MVARTGFEPVISALRGRCPRPLDERATCFFGWDRGSRTPTDGTRNRCPTIRRYPNALITLRRKIGFYSLELFKSINLNLGPQALQNP